MYADPTATISVQQSHAEGNAGNQMKLAGSPTVQNSVIVGNCAYFQGIDNMSGNNSGGANTAGDQCRAMGNALVLGMQPSIKATVQYNTITGQGDCLILAINGDSTSSVAIANNALLGKPDWVKADQSPQPQSCLFYWDSGPASWPVSYAGTLVWQVKDNVCPAGTGNVSNVDTQVTNANLTGINALPLATSPLINKANTAVAMLASDYLSAPRPALGGYDIGAIEYQGTSGGSSGSGTSTPTASFSFAVNGLSATFADASTDSGGTIGAHAWVFGDGTTSTAVNPSHTYGAAGTYTVSETVTDSSNGKTSTATHTVTVSAVVAGGSCNPHKRKCP